MSLMSLMWSNARKVSIARPLYADTTLSYAIKASIQDLNGCMQHSEDKVKTMKTMKTYTTVSEESSLQTEPTS